MIIPLVMVCSMSSAERSSCLEEETPASANSNSRFTWNGISLFTLYALYTKIDDQKNLLLFCVYQHYSTSKEASLVPVHKMVQMIHTYQPRMRLKGPLWQYYHNTFNTQQFSFNIVKHTTMLIQYQCRPVGQSSSASREEDHHRCLVHNTLSWTTTVHAVIFNTIVLRTLYYDIIHVNSHIILLYALTVEPEDNAKPLLFKGPPFSILLLFSMNIYMHR